MFLVATRRFLGSPHHETLNALVADRQMQAVKLFVCERNYGGHIVTLLLISFLIQK
jgi:hypothetical protein